MDCIVTAGPTYEPLDKVRRLTNFSTGRLGAELACFLTDRGHQVTLLIGEQATYGGERRARQVEVFTTTADLTARLASRAGTASGAVFHAAAVSDFAFSKMWFRQPDGQLEEVRSGKISTRDGTLLAELAPTPKIIAVLRDLFPAATLVGWKFEVDGDRSSVLVQARKQLADCRTDACVTNGPAYGDGFGLLHSKGTLDHYEGKQALFEGLEALLK
jgi:phosphopantothenoylcysteine synthetase/decarboxylase